MKVIYHADCPDGFTAATIVKGKYKNCELIRGIHGESPPLVEDDAVIIVDFSYKRDVLIEMAKSARNILIIDHHKSAEAELVDLPDNVTTIFDMEESGASLAWKYYYKDEEMPDFVRYIKDRDLWQHLLPKSREINIGINSMEHTDWGRYIFGACDMEELFYKKGKAIMSKQNKDIWEMIKTSSFKMKISEYTVPALNVPPMWASDAGEILAKGKLFAVTYYDSELNRNFSLRSDPFGMDVSEIAQQFGGGGHKHAAGFKIAKDAMV